LDGLHAVDEGGWIVYRELRDGLVSPLERAVAASMLEQAAATFDIAAPEVRWFDSETDGERAYANKYGWRDWTWWPGDPRLLGLYVRPLDEIWLRCGLEPYELAVTVVHEVAHAAQRGDRLGREEAAEAFAVAFASAFSPTERRADG
jgi:hypothetical protein